MSDSVEELARRLVIGHKRDGRSVYDEQVKAELVARCASPGVSVSAVARRAGVNANQLSRWIRELGEGRRRSAGAAERALTTTDAAFIPVAIEAAGPAPTLNSSGVSIQAWMPNGVVVELTGCDPAQAREVINVLGRLQCSGSTIR